jgi:hypothetical protein
MKPRKTRELNNTLLKKGFRIDDGKSHHRFFYLVVDGRKSAVYTYLSHGQDEYGKPLMAKLRKQLRFPDVESAESFFDCPMTGDEYVDLLKKEGVL